MTVNLYSISNATKGIANLTVPETVVNCAKSFESLLKGIIEKHNWKIKTNPNAIDLINGCLENGLLPKYLQDKFTMFEKLLNAIGVIRNKNGGHGQGSEIKEVDLNLVKYILNLTATNLLYICDCDKEFCKKNSI